jgi:hypothetical protein
MRACVSRVQNTASVGVALTTDSFVISPPPPPILLPPHTSHPLCFQHHFCFEDRGINGHLSRGRGHAVCASTLVALCARCHRFYFCQHLGAGPSSGVARAPPPARGPPPPPPRALRNGLLRARGPGALELISVLGRRSWREGACLGALQLSERAAVRRRAAKQRTEEPALRRKGTRRVQLVRRDGRDVSTRSPRNRYLSSEWLHASWASRGVPLWSRKSLRGSAAG